MGALLKESTMKQISAKGSVKIPDNIQCELKSRVVKITGPRGTLTKSFKHMAVDMYMSEDGKTLHVEKWFASSKELAVIKTTCSHVQNMLDGVYKGFEYRMKLVYAHFPTNVVVSAALCRTVHGDLLGSYIAHVQIASNKKSLDIVNFIGQK